MIRTPGSLDAFITALNGFDARSEWGPAAATILRDRMESPRGRESIKNFAPLRYTRTLIYRNVYFELVALCWAPGSGSPIHDHGGMQCAMAVYSGSLMVEDYSVINTNLKEGHAKIAASGSALLESGGIDIRTSDRDLHRVYAQHEPTISLHVYARPLENFLIFDPANNSCRMAFARYDHISV